MADLNDAFKIYNNFITKKSVYRSYIFRCIYCSGSNVFAMTNDGGSIQFCNTCKKKYKARCNDKIAETLYN
jgi:metal-dependent HD superfamily phosphatase/phosphodiesterase